MINKNSPIPIYYQLEELIRNNIENGIFREGDLVPSERTLSEEYGISRMTIRQALTNLVKEGLLVREKGKGTFVAKKKLEQPLMNLTSFSEDMKGRGLEPSTILIGFEEVQLSATECKELNIDVKSISYRVKRLRLADGIPMAYEELVSPKSLLGEVNETMFLQKSFYNHIEEKLKLRIDSAKQTLEPAISNEIESNLLHIKIGSPVLLMRRIGFLADGTPFELVKSVYRGDRYKFITEMKRS
ncbi:GntR family transcriptional regulator [Evansella sp. AB-rgal1]|uniref:GntR family transcriptional regulator n=1 Tax=Evansella sp. AB-rgal1 TaxID=3242696 RepID=UPI00359E9626